MPPILTRTFAALAVAAIATTALPSRAAIQLSGSVVERSAPIRIAACSVEADEATFVPRVLFTDQLAKPIASAIVIFEFLDTSGAPLVRVPAVIPGGRSALPAFPAGATSVTCALERAAFKDGSTFVYGAASNPNGPAIGAIVGGALAIGAAAAVVAGGRKSSGGTPANAAPTPSASPGTTATPAPTATPFPTATPVPTATPAPTATPVPGSSPTPIRTSSPAPLATQHAPVVPPTARPTALATRMPAPSAPPAPPQSVVPRGHERGL